METAARRMRSEGCDWRRLKRKQSLLTPQMMMTTINSLSKTTRRRAAPSFLLILLNLFVTLSYCTAFTHYNRRTPRRTCNMLHASKSGGNMINTADEYDNAIANRDRPAMLWFTAPWCGPCRLSIPVVKDIIKQYSGKILPFEICTDDLPDVVANAGVVSIPTIQIYFRGKLMDTLVGCVAKQVLAGSIDKVLDDIAVETSSQREQ